MCIHSTSAPSVNYTTYTYSLMNFTRYIRYIRYIGISGFTSKRVHLNIKSHVNKNGGQPIFLPYICVVTSTNKRGEPEKNFNLRHQVTLTGLKHWVETIHKLRLRRRWLDNIQLENDVYCGTLRNTAQNDNINTDTNNLLTT